MPFPQINIVTAATIKGIPDSGDLIYGYNAFQNLNKIDDEEVSLKSLKLDVEKANISIYEPLEMNLEESYDGSINMILSDKKNPPKIVNSRFYPTSSTTYKVADRKGNLDTNIYSEDNFKIETSLVKIAQTIVTTQFLGIEDSGKMKIGNYTFYFKLADVDGNETDFVAESGKVVCHIGAVNNPNSIRGGLLEENSGKLVKFTLSNLDLAYNYINIYYTRSTGDDSSEIVKAYRIQDKIKITGTSTNITITGFEEHIEISVDDINNRHISFDSIKTVENCQNITFAGNISNNYDLYTQLEKLSLHVTPKLIQDTEGIGNLTAKYLERYNNPDYGFEYYNARNIYYKLGLWEKEIYRYGIYYILNDYSISPVFNIRGVQYLSEYTNFKSFNIADNINYGEDYIIEGTNENVKGVFRVDPGTLSIFDSFTVENRSIRPLGLRFEIPEEIINGNFGIQGLKELTKGFVIVRQNRIPTIIAQSLSIATAKKSGTPLLYGSNGARGTNFSNSYFTEGFLQPGTSPKLGSNYFKVASSDVFINSLLCPEASLRTAYFANIFNSSEFNLVDFGYDSVTNPINTDITGVHFEQPSMKKNSYAGKIPTEITLITPGIELTRNNKFTFSSQAGNPEFPEKHLNPVLGNYEEVTDNSIPDSTWNSDIKKIRGVYNTYLGTTSDLSINRYYNIYQKDYDFVNKWKDYFKLRFNDESPYLPVSDRIGWDVMLVESGKGTTPNCFRGDCYINTYTHRMNWNFIDPELPTNHRVVDPFTWAQNFKILSKKIKVIDSAGNVTESLLNYNKLLPLFTFKDEGGNKVLEPDDKNYKKYSEINGVFGVDKINRPDVNAVPLGHWFTFKICSSINLAMRDIDFNNPAEEAIHKQKRGFYPLQALNRENHLAESTVINQGISYPLSHRYYFNLPDVPFIKTNFSNRIYYSNILQNSSFTNGNRVFRSIDYQDYTMEYGALVKLVEWYGTLIAVMEHGILLIPVNERAMMTNASGENVYINTDNVLPKNPQVLSNTFGSKWPDSIVKTTRYIYGIDTVAKKIWRTDGKSFENISDMTIQKFLNDNIKISELEKTRTIGINVVKTHFNAFKSDVYFTFINNNTEWNLCWNELLNKWVTRYTWFPEFSENINNLFYTFANRIKHPNKQNILYKHGFAGGLEQEGKILPTKWYDEVKTFEFEFVVSDVLSTQKIFNNLKIISNSTPPESFEFEVVGEGFDWVKDKSIIINNISINSDISTLNSNYLTYLKANRSKKTKLPYIWLRDNLYPTANPDIPKFLKNINLQQNSKTKEIVVRILQEAKDLKSPGNTRLNSNMQYLEDIWEVQIQPIQFKYGYLQNKVLNLSKTFESRLRDKYLKVRIRYDGNDYAIINAIKTLYTISYA